eukprot:CAMPEP_0172206406 /NCGR_PEP_ID=MMETSP1050-20130122/33197_1 /TAXON_ID=233186 /ORGANISM="Cryptomonas curvata, Strain CCAP979/52" /LENGTH=173 /DNA_ID=CAMNT_0012885479 /DNA_START=63 /DNA_END=580 /DNA_ORIENTATION=+
MYRNFMILLVGVTTLSIIINTVLPRFVSNDSESYRVKILEDRVSVLQMKTRLLLEREAKDTKVLEADKDNIRLLESKLAGALLTATSLTHRLEQTACSVVVASVVPGSTLCTAPRNDDPPSHPRKVDLHSVKQPEKSHWNYHSSAFPGRKIGFWINTHDPSVEDGFVSAQIHA